MIKKYFVSQLGLLCLVSIIVVLSNVFGYGIGFWESITGVFVMGLIGLAGLVFNKFLSRWVKLPSMLFVSLFGLLLSICPIAPVQELVRSMANNLHFMAPTTALGVCAGISLGKDFKEFSKTGWKYILITLLVITGTFFFSALVAHVVLVLTGAI